MSAPVSTLVSLLVAAPDADDDALARTVASAARQDDRRWEVVVASPARPDDDAPPPTAPAPARHGRGGSRQPAEPPARAEDPRVRHLPVTLPEGVAPDDVRALLLEAARGEACGDVVGVLAPGDQLEPGALAAARMLLEAEPHPDVVYTDEQWPGEGASGIATKPDYLPHHHRSHAYLGRLCLVRAALAEQAGGFRTGFGGAEEWDLQLRVTELTSRVAHVPVVAVSRPAPPPADAAAAAAVQRAAAAAVARSGRPGRVEPAEVPHGVRVWWDVAEPPLVSVVMPTAGGRRTVRGEDGPVVLRALRSLLEGTTYERWELVLVTSEHTPAAVVDAAAELLGDRLVHAPIAGPFSFSASVNEGARHASGELLLLLNDDVEAIEPRWLDRMVSVAQDPAVGAVGAKLLFEDGTIQHVGVFVEDSGLPAHNLIFEPDGPGAFGRTALDMDHLAVTGACLLTPAAVFSEVGGMCPDLPLNFNDVDYCLKVRATGRDVVCTPFARLHHYESTTRVAGITDAEREHFERRWGLRRMTDPHPEYRSVL